MQETTKNILQLNNVTMIYPDGTVGIKNLSLEIWKGEIFGFLGQNGAGKTTTIRAILNILIPQEGEIIVNGKTVSRDTPEIREDIGYLPGELHIPPYYLVDDFLHYIASLKNRPSTRMMEIAKRVELPMNKKIGELSKGNKQKLGIVLAFMHDPQIYILDEPTSGLDPIYQQKVYDLIIEEKKRGKTIFFSSHNLDEVQKICDRVGVIREGKLVSLENVNKLADQISRKLTAKITNLSEDDIVTLAGKMEIYSHNFDTGELTIVISRPSELSNVVDELNNMNSRLQDLSYPPASLEEFFLSKYRSEV